MADYSTEKGFTIQSLASDPKLSRAAGGTWASGGAMNTARAELQGAGNSQTAAVFAGGSTASNTPSALTETYDGSTWTEVGDIPAGVQNSASAGTSTSAFLASGMSPHPTVSTNTYEWNGSSWTAGGACNTARYDLFGTGTETAGLIAGGNNPPGTNYQNTETYDGSTWTEVNDMNSSATRGRGGAGSSTAGIAVGGEPPTSASVETWDGTSWTEVNAIPTVTQGGRAAGTSTSTLFFGGYTPPTSAYSAGTFAFDGTNWLASGDLATTVGIQGATGADNTSALSAGGFTPSRTTATEVFTAPATVSIAQEGQVWYNTASNVLKGFAQAGTGAWASGGNVNTARTQCGSAGTQTAALLFLGESPYADKNKTEEYDGTTWTETNDANTARQAVAISIGTQTTAMAVGGTAGGTTAGVYNEQYDGSCWAEGNNLNTPLYSRGGAGSSTAALAWGGTPPAQSINESWNGTSWSEVNNINTARFKCNGGGTQTAAVTAGGQAPAFQAITETWDGTSWTEVGNLNANCTEYSSANAGTSTAWMQYGGARPALSATCEEWNGTSWSSIASMAIARQAVGGGGTVLAGIVSGSNAPLTTACEEFTVPNAVKTFTSS